MKMFLNGTAMQGQPDHPNLLGAPIIGPARTAPRYRFFAVRDEFPGLVPGDAETPYGPGEPASIQGELYELEESVWHTSLGPGEPPELELGTIELDDGSQVNAMILQFDRIAPGDKVVEITSFGGWRAYQSSLRGMG
jgi:gamma-glutamylcyclotransferase (GGCT)/AIG2-like uncharacterized protein YtfP